MTDAFPPRKTIDVAATFTEGAVSRRRFLQFLSGAASAVAVNGIVVACSQDTGNHNNAGGLPAASTITPASLVRLSSVVSPQDGGLYDDLLPDFVLGPPEDSAQVQDLTDLVEAFRRIANTQAPFVVNDIEGVKYLT